MKTEKIIENLKNGNYTIEPYNSCDCYVADITNNGGIIIDGNECYRSNSLEIDGVQIAYYTQFDGLTLDQVERDDHDIIWDYLDESGILTKLSIPDDYDDHDMESMVRDYLETLKTPKFYRDDKEGFSNRFEIIIDEDGSHTDQLQDNWYEISIDDAAWGIAYKGDAATQAYNSFLVL